MKTSLLAAALIGGVIGSVVTYSITTKPAESQSLKITPCVQNSKDNQSESSEEVTKSDEVPDDYYRLWLTDPTDIGQRDRCIAMWYANEYRTENDLGVHTGHKFGQVGNRRSPVEKLEEQLAFWKEFLAESKRLNAIQRSKIEAEQAVPSDGHKPSNSVPSATTTAPADAH